MRTHPITDGDIRLIPSLDGARLDFSGGQPLMDTGLETSVYVSLFTANWWGNATVPADRRQSSRVQATADSATMSNQSRLVVQQAASDALAWMVRDGVAASVDAQVAIVGVQKFKLTVSISQPAAPIQVLRYQINWGEQREITASGRVTREVHG